MLNLLARNPWPTPNISGASSDLDGMHSTPNLATSTRFLNNIDSLIAKVDYNPNTSNNISGRYYYGNSTQSFPFRAVGGRTAAGIQYRNSDPCAVGRVVVGEDRQLVPGQ